MASFHEILPKLFFAQRKALIDRTIVYGLSYGQPKMLDYLYRHDGCMQKDFCREFSLEPPTVSSVLQKMEKNGLISRRRDPGSARTVNVFITDKGRGIQRELRALYQEMEDIALAGLSPAEREALCGAMSRVHDNLARFLEGAPEKSPPRDRQDDETGR